MCLESYFVRCLSLRPARPPEGNLVSIPTPEEGHPYEVPAQEPPSWIEEHRVRKDMWLMQVHHETQIIRLKGRLAWAKTEISSLDGLSPVDFHGLGVTYQREQMLTVVDFLGRLSGERIKPWHQLYIFEGSFHHGCAPELQFAFGEDNRRQGGIAWTTPRRPGSFRGLWRRMDEYRCGPLALSHIAGMVSPSGTSSG